MTKIKRRPLAGLVLAAASTLGLQPAAAADPQKVAFLLDWLPSGEMAAYYAGAAKGYFAEQGLDVTISRGYGSPDTATKIATGVADFGLADISAVYAARTAAAAPIKAISAVYSHSPHSLFVLESSGIASFKDLAGKKIAASAGNSHKLYFPTVAKAAGLDPDSVTWVTADGSAMAGLLISKQVDAAPFFSIHEYYQNKMAKQQGEKISVLPFVETGFAIYATTVIASEDTIAKRPDVARKFLSGLQKSLIWAKDNQQEACEMHVKAVPEVALDDCMGSLKAMMGFVFNPSQEKFGLGHFDPERLAFTYKEVAEAQELDPSVDPASAIDESLLP